MPFQHNTPRRLQAPRRIVLEGHSSAENLPHFGGEGIQSGRKTAATTSSLRNQDPGSWHNAAVEIRPDEIDAMTARARVLEIFVGAELSRVYLLKFVKRGDDLNGTQSLRFSAGNPNRASRGVRAARLCRNARANWLRSSCLHSTTPLSTRRALPRQIARGKIKETLRKNIH